MLHQGEPLQAYPLGHLGKAVARQIHQSARGTHLEKIDELRASGSTAHACEPGAMRDGIDRSGFSGIGPTRERHLAALVGRELTCLRGAGHEFDMGVDRHGGCREAF